MSEVNLGEICLAPGVKMIPRDKAIRFGIVPSAYKGEQGEPGPIGPQGPAGPEGPRGLKGDKGEQGEPGLKGEKGDPGERGPRGVQGERGEKGEKGERGLKGDKGERGEPGKDGADGVDGAKGEKGDTGERGPRGEKGDPGPQGVQGEKGEKGDTGERGPTGPVGATPALRIGTVSTLTSGAFAQASISGTIENPVLNLGLPRGLKGDQGEKGEKGEKGEQGEPGTGIQIHICSADEYDAETRVPTVTLPEENTFYLVPAENGSSPDMFVEWIFANNAWEMFGSAKIDLSNYVQKTDYATSSNAGVIKIGVGLKTLSNIVYLDGADAASIKGGVNSTNAIMPGRQDQAVFYGLAKAAGDTTQKKSSNAVGSYTNEAKASILAMLGAASDTDLSNKADKTDTVLTTTLSRGRKYNEAVGSGSFAFGDNVIASGAMSHAEGGFTTASGYVSHAEGSSTTASGNISHAEGNGTIASALMSHAEGNLSKAYGYFSHAEGYGTMTGSRSQHVFGEFNSSTGDVQVSDRGKYVEVVGNGTGENFVSNARALDWSGNEYLAGDVYVQADRYSSGGKKLATEQYVDDADASVKSAFEALGLSVVNGQLCVTYEEGNP